MLWRWVLITLLVSPFTRLQVDDRHPIAMYAEPHVALAPRDLYVVIRTQKDERNAVVAVTVMGEGFSTLDEQPISQLAAQPLRYGPLPAGDYVITAILYRHDRVRGTWEAGRATDRVEFHAADPGWQAPPPAAAFQVCQGARFFRCQPFTEAHLVGQPVPLREQIRHGGGAGVWREN